TQGAHPREGRYQVVLGKPQLQAALHEPVEVAGGDDRFIATSGFGEPTDRQRAPCGDSPERANDRRPRLGLTLRADRRKAERVDQRVERFFVVARIEPPAPQLRITPPEPLIDLVPPCRWERGRGGR